LRAADCLTRQRAQIQRIAARTRQVQGIDQNAAIGPSGVPDHNRGVLNGAHLPPGHGLKIDANAKPGCEIAEISECCDQPRMIRVIAANAGLPRSAALSSTGFNRSSAKAPSIVTNSI
jgi:hypothetical protein